MAINNLFRQYPSTQSSGVIRQQTQEALWTQYIGGKFNTEAKRGAGFHYIQTLRGGGTARAAKGFAAQHLSDMFVQNGQLELPLYYLRARASVMADDEARAGLLNIGLTNELRNVALNAISQGIHRGLLYGFNGSTGEGLLNTTGIANIPLPNDSGSNSTIATYKADELLAFLLAQINTMESSLKNLARVTVVAAPVLTLNYINNVKIVPLSSFQSQGAGVATVGNALNQIRRANNLPEIKFIDDNSLLGKGLSSKDAILLIAPEIKHVSSGVFNNNQFGQGANEITQNIVMVSDSEDIVHLAFPNSADETSHTFEFFTSPGTAVRPEAVRILSATTASL